MESNATFSRRRPSSHMRENHSLESDIPLVKRNREGSREQAHALSDDDDMPTSRGEKYRRKKKHASSTLNIPSNPAPRPGPSTDTFVERSHRSSKQRHGVSSSLSDVPSNMARTISRSKREVSREGRYSSAKASSVAVVSDDEAGPPSTYGGPVTAMEFNRMKRELEALKKVCSFLIYGDLCSSLNLPSKQSLTPKSSKSRQTWVARYPPRLSLTL